MNTALNGNKPSVGRLVHYTTDDGTVVPALVCAVHDTIQTQKATTQVTEKDADGNDVTKDVDVLVDVDLNEVTLKVFDPKGEKYLNAAYAVAEPRRWDWMPYQKQQTAPDFPKDTDASFSKKKAK